MNASVRTTSSSSAGAEREYKQAWNGGSHTRFELPPLNVNRVLRDRYRIKPQKALTRTMMWDMETKKAWDPRSYIPYVVSAGHSWGRESLQDSSERFCRASMQQGWISQSSGLVLEEVFVSHTVQRILFMGRGSMVDDAGKELRASSFQPLFHVEHGVGGSEEEPLNLWSIVLLTDQYDTRFIEPFEHMVREGLLPGFIEIYIQRDLQVVLSGLLESV